MFAFSRTWVEDDLFPMLSTPVSTYLQRKRRGFAHLVQPMYAKTRTWGTRPGGKACWKAKDLLHNPCTRHLLPVERGAGPVQGSRLDLKNGAYNATVHPKHSARGRR